MGNIKKRYMSVPKLVQQKAESLGVEGEKWLHNLEDTIPFLERQWQIRIGKALDGGTEAFVAEALTEDGVEAMIKLAMPSMEGNTVFEQEILALTIAAGDGYVRLLNDDLNHRAVLLERLGTPLKDTGYPMEVQMEIICDTLKKSWGRPLPEGHNLQTAHDIINWFSNFIPELWVEVERPCSKQLVDKALLFLAYRLSSTSLETSVLVHGDAHNGNILQDMAKAQPSFKMIDPDGIVAEPAYDLGVLMREWMNDFTINPLENGRKRCSFLSNLTGSGAQAIWEWGCIQSVSTGLLLLKTGQRESGLQMLKVAEAWSED